ncbi:MAG TPA: hypothetical protein PLU71_04265 [Candidatus Dependentiae bacterium]|nr:hypothetical protein [Candidatus Dependentiae bacterium]HRQ63047.1 hypothetical protein [Candidatus Dependentiae bacterium]
MKNMSKLMLVTLALLSIGNSAFAYIFSFTNHTKNTIHVRMKLGGIGEPWYYLGKDPYQTKENTKNVMPAGATYELRFDAGDTVTMFQKNFEKDKYKNDYARKFGFCLAFIQYSPNGRTWSNVEPVFVDSKTSNDLLNASSAFSKGASETAGKIMKQIPQTKVVGEVVEKLPLDKLVSSIGTMIQKSMCRDRHFDIIPNMVLSTDTKTEELKVAEAIGQPLFITVAK